MNEYLSSIRRFNIPSYHSELALDGVYYCTRAAVQADGFATGIGIEVVDMLDQSVTFKNMIGRTVKGVVVKQTRQGEPGQQLFILFSDDSYVEIWGYLYSFSVTSNLDRGGIDAIRKYMGEREYVQSEYLDPPGTWTKRDDASELYVPTLALALGTAITFIFSVAFFPYLCLVLFAGCAYLLYKSKFRR